MLQVRIEQTASKPMTEDARIWDSDFIVLGFFTWLARARDSMLEDCRASLHNYEFVPILLEGLDAS